MGLLTFAEQREEFYLKRKSILEEETKKILSVINNIFDCVQSDPIRTKSDLVKSVEKMRKENITSVIISLPIWSSPNLPALAVKILDIPVVLYGNARSDSSSTVALLAAGGALDQMGYPHKRIIGDITDKGIIKKIEDFCTAAYTKEKIKGMTFGCFGGRGLGICTTTADPAQWQSEFGVDIEHIDQMEIVRVAESLDRDLIQNYVKWLKDNIGKIEFDNNLLTPEKLQIQIKSYLAIKKIISDMKLDFIGVKCQPEMSDHYALQCLSQMMLNDPYDAEGAKKPIVSSCEADIDGALSMQILKLLSGLKPTVLLDIRNIREGEFVGANCGSMSSWYTNYASEARTNLKDVHIIPNAFGKAGGGATQFVAGDRDIVTLARLCRKNGKYWMAILKGSIINKPREELKKTTWSFPHAFIKTDFDREKFFETYGSNHIHLGVGDLTGKLAEFCTMQSIDYLIY